MAAYDDDYEGTTGSDQQDQQDQPEQRGIPLPAPVPAAPGSTTVGDEVPASHVAQLRAARAQAQAAQAARFDPNNHQLDPDGPVARVAAPPEKTSALGDFARQTWIATVGMGEAAVGAASFAARQMGADPETVTHIEDQKARLADYLTTQVNKLSPEAQAAMHASIFGGTDASGAAVPSPGDVGWGHYIGAQVAGLIPQAVLAVVPGTLAGRAVGMALSAGAFGTLDAGEAYNAFTTQIDKAKPEELMRSPVYKALRDQGASDEQARQQLVQGIAPSLFAARFGVGAAAGAGIGGLAAKGALGAGASLARRAGVGAAEGAAVMGGQGAADDALTQQSEGQAGLSDAFDPKRTAFAFASGALGGAVLGAGAGVLHPAAPAAAPVRDVAPAEAAALKVALGPSPAPKPDLNPESGGVVPSPPSSPAGPDAGAWPHPNAEIRPQPMWPHPTDPDAPPVPIPYPGAGPAPTPTPTPAPVAPDPSRQPFTQVDPDPSRRPFTPKPVVFPGAGEAKPVEAAPAPVVEPAPAPAPKPATVAFMITKADRAKLAGLGYAPEDIAQLKPVAAKKLIADGTRKIVEPEAAAAAAPEPEIATTVAEPAPAAPEVAPEVAPVIPKATPEVIADKPAAPVETPAAAQAPAVEAARVESTPEAKPAAAAPLQEAAPTSPLTPSTRPKSARQLAKERQAPPGERIKAAAFVDTATPAKVEPEVAQRLPEQVMASMREALTKAGEGIKPIGKGQVGPALTKARREIEQLFAKQPDTSDAAMHAAIAEWASSSTEPLPLSLTRRRPVADAMLKLMTGKGLSSQMTAREAMHADGARSGATPKGEVASDGGRESAVEDAEAMKLASLGDDVDQGRERVRAKTLGTDEGEPSQGVAAYETVAPKARAEGSNTERTAKDLLERVLDGEISVHEAHAALGEKAAGTRGRDRTIKNFAAYLDDRINYAEDVSNQHRIFAEAAVVERDKSLSMQARSENTKRITEAMDETGAERAGRLRELRAELEDPVGHATTVAAVTPEVSPKETTGKLAPDRAAQRQVLEDAIARNKAESNPETKAASIPGTPAFQRWFGASKIVDDAGKPLRVFHGTGADVEAFSAAHIGSTDAGFLGTGFYFGSAGKATGYSRGKQGGNIMPVYLRMENPLRLDEPLRTASTAVRDALGLPREASSEEVTRAAKAQGYDGAIRGPREKPTEYVVFDPTQIKSSIGNNGAFDRADPRVNFRPSSTEHGINPAASRYVRMAGDPRVNEVIARNLAASEKYNAPYTSHDLLRNIINSSVIKTELRPLRELAMRLLKIAPDLPVMTPERAVERGYPVPDDSSRGYLGAAMRENGQTSHILLQHDMSGEQFSRHVEVGLHEVLHSVTASHIHYLIDTNPGHADLRVLNAISRDLYQHYRSGQHLDGLDPAAVRDTLLNPHELHAMLMSNPSMQALASRITPSASLLAELRSQGYDGPARRNVWSVFTDWVRRAVGLGTSKSGSETTLLDHILRPLGDITDRAAEFNRRHYDSLVPDPVVRGLAEPMLRQAGAPGPVRRALDAVDPQGLSDKLKRGWLASATSDGIVQWNQKLFANFATDAADRDPNKRVLLPAGNPLVRWRDAGEGIAHVAKAVHDRYADRAEAMVRGLQGPERDALGKLTNEATINDVQLGRGADNTHLTTPEQQATQRDLEARFARLSPEGQRTYEGTRDLYSEWYRAERAGQLAALSRQVLPEATEAQQQAVAQALSSKQKTEAFLASDEHQALSAAFGAEWTTSRALVKGVAKVHRLGFVAGDYFPLRRFGDYVIRYGSGDTLGVEMFEHRGEAEARRAELAKQTGADRVDDLSQVDSKRDSDQRIAPVHGPLVDELTQAMSRRGLDAGDIQATRDLLNQVLLEHATHSEAARTAMRRRGVTGASEDAARVLAQDFLMHGNRMGTLEHGPVRQKALSDMRLMADDLRNHGQPGESITARSVIREAERRIAVGDDAQSVLQGVSRQATTLGYVQSLMSFSHAITSSIEAHMNSTSILGARHGPKAAFALAKALTDVSPRMLAQGVGMTLKAVGRGLRAADWNLAHLARDRFVARGANKGHMDALFAALDRTNLIDHTMQREMQRIAKPGVSTTGVGRVWSRFLDFNAAGAHAVDVANKSAIAKAAFDLEFRKSGSVDTAVAYAVKVARDTSPNYNVSNKARITTAAGPLGGFAAPMLQFKQYGIHMYSVLSNLLREGMHGETPEARREARLAFAGMMATHAAMAGGLTLLADPLRYIGGAYDLATGAARPHDYQTDVRGFLADVMGPELAEIAARGLPHLAGIDIHRRVGLANLLEVPELESFDKKGVLKMLASAMTGAAGEDAAAMVGGMSKLRQGDLAGGALDLVPRVVRDGMKAIRLNDQGLVDGRGQTILSASKVSARDVAAQALGFQPAPISEFREGRAAVQEAKMEAQTDRGRLVSAWVRAEPIDRAAVMSDIRQFNQSNPGFTVTIDQLLQAAQAARKAQSGAPDPSFGLHLTPKARAALAGAGRFAAQ